MNWPSCSTKASCRFLLHPGMGEPDAAALPPIVAAAVLATAGYASLPAGDLTGLPRVSGWLPSSLQLSGVVNSFGPREGLPMNRETPRAIDRKTVLNL
jgi:hypothetical protein